MTAGKSNLPASVAARLLNRAKRPAPCYCSNSRTREPAPFLVFETMCLR